jgi:hypothetical protein
MSKRANDVTAAEISWIGRWSGKNGTWVQDFFSSCLEDWGNNENDQLVFT